MLVHFIFFFFLTQSYLKVGLKKEVPLKACSKAIHLCKSSNPGFTCSTHGANQTEQIISEK